MTFTENSTQPLGYALSDVTVIERAANDQTASEQAASKHGVWMVPDGWQQGRGAWGGLVVAAAVRAAQAAEGGSRPVRSVTAHMLAPIPAGPTRVVSSEVRRGSSTSTWQIDFYPDGSDLAMSVVVILGEPRPGDRVEFESPPIPTVADWHDVDLIPLGPPIAPPFTQHLQFRIVRGIPYSGSDSEDVVIWLSYPGQQPRIDYAAMLGLVDGPWTVAIARSPQVRPMATLSFMATPVIDPESIDTREPFLYRAQVLGGYDGFLTERRQLWTADGRLAVENLQVITIIK